MESKYYTPQIEEFRVGFECEFFNNMQDKQWNKIVCDTDHIGIAYTCFEEGTIEWEDDISHTFRVKYLDSEDIESFGFKYVENYSLISDIKVNLFVKEIDKFNEWIITLENENVFISLKSDEFLMAIPSSKQYWTLYDLFRGKIKNKSELEVLLKQLEIR
jgi:hypothetical protein